jgi:hypothetical protein
MARSTRSVALSDRRESNGPLGSLEKRTASDAARKSGKLIAGWNTNLPSSVDRAARRYTNALRQGFNSCRADGDTSTQAANFRSALEYADLRASQVKQVLCDHGVAPIQFVAYRSFGLHVDKLVRQYSEGTLNTLVADAVLRWRCLGLNAEVLEAVCEQVFGLDSLPMDQIR